MISPHLPSAPLAAVTLAAGSVFAQPAPETPAAIAAPAPGSPAAPSSPAPASAASQADPRGAPPRDGAQMTAGVSSAAPVTRPLVAPGAGDAQPPAALGVLDDDAEHEPRPGDEDAGSGMLGVVRIDGKGRGFAAGAGLLIARGRLDLEILALRSDVFGGYAGARFRPYGGMLRPYVAAGLPGFVFDHDEQVDGAIQSTKRLSIGLRCAIGLEVRLDHHVSAFGDLGFEHFFLSDGRFEADLFVPTLGVIGRL